MQVWNVTVQHPVAAYAGTFQIRVRPGAGDQSWYAENGLLGCGRGSVSPERAIALLVNNNGGTVVSAKPVRDVAFLEATARAMPDSDVSYGRVMVCFVSYGQSFDYFQKFRGGSVLPISREEAETLMAEPTE